MKEQAAKAAALRRTGAPPEQRTRINAQFDTADDLYTTCQDCKASRVGSLAQLKQPCECSHATPST